MDISYNRFDYGVWHLATLAADTDESMAQGVKPVLQNRFLADPFA